MNITNKFTFTINMYIKDILYYNYDINTLIIKKSVPNFIVIGIELNNLHYHTKVIIRLR